MGKRNRYTRDKARKKAKQTAVYEGFHKAVDNKIQEAVEKKRSQALKNKMYNIAIENTSNNIRYNYRPSYIGRMDLPCVCCGALHFLGESTLQKCCVNGHGSFESLTNTPEFLETYLEKLIVYRRWF